MGTGGAGICYTNLARQSKHRERDRNLIIHEVKSHFSMWPLNTFSLVRQPFSTAGNRGPDYI